MNFYREMLRMRLFEEKLLELSQAGILRGSLHLARGQEALPAGACAALRAEDYLTVTYRGHGYVLAKGCDLQRVFAEILGRRDGLCKGKGGKMHLIDLEHGLLGANGIVGAAVPIGAGGALAAWMDGRDQVALTVFGDGAINQGVVHETLGMAALYKLPLILLCENNLYSEMTPLARSSAVIDLSSRAASYGIRAEQIDGNDVVAVYEAVSKAREAKEPVFIEAFTYRTCGHYQLDPGLSYRSKEEVEEWEKKCPIARHRAQLKVSPQELKKIEIEVRDEIEEAARFALESPEPDRSELEAHVFA